MKTMVQALALVGALGEGGERSSRRQSSAQAQTRASLFGLAGRRRSLYGRSDGRVHA